MPKCHITFDMHHANLCRIRFPKGNSLSHAFSKQHRVKPSSSWCHRFSVSSISRWRSLTVATIHMDVNWVCRRVSPTSNFLRHSELILKKWTALVRVCSLFPNVMSVDPRSSMGLGSKSTSPVRSAPLRRVSFSQSVVLDNLQPMSGSPV